VGRPEGRLTAYLLRAEFYRTVVSLVRRGAARIVPIRVVSSFSDGETIDVPGKPRALHTPGHSPGSAALLLEDRGVVLTGDSLVTRNPFTGRLGPQIMPSGLNADSDQALRSIAVFDSLAAPIVLPGHGEPWTEGVSEAARLARAAGRS
jgi:glyoxylase-like metal-dependent hydrolase (beta-lactamase superfamily II)